MNTFRSIFHSAAIVDFGSGSTKTDYSGEETPRYIFKSTVGRPKYTKLFSGAVENFVVSPEPEKMGLYKTENSIKRGIFTTDEDARCIISKVYSDLAINNAKEVPMLLSEPIFAPKSHKKRIAKICFESYETHYVLLVNQCLLSLYAFGKTDGLVVDSGEGVTQIGVVYNGHKIDGACEKMNLGGIDVSNYLKSLFLKNDVLFHPSTEKYFLDDIKNKLCKVPESAIEFNKILNSSNSRDKTNNSSEYLLPDGKSIKISDLQKNSGEILFNPSLGNIQSQSIPQLLLDSIEKVDPDLKNHLTKMIYLSGGNTQLSGFDMRFLNEVNKSSNPMKKSKLFVSSVDRSLIPWQGGSIITALSSIQKMWITLKDLDDHGDRIFLIKSL